ncbi:MAG: leucine-rich repeat protein, partial [Raoultibacter sp.]
MQPAKPGDLSKPSIDESSELSGFSFELLPDYTLSVSWQGIEVPASSLTIPSSAEIAGVSYRVSTIADGAFAQQTTLTSVAIPSSVATIEKNAFLGCENLS